MGVARERRLACHEKLQAVRQGQTKESRTYEDNTALGEFAGDDEWIVAIWGAAVEAWDG